jgi:hypothetical protein
MSEKIKTIEERMVEAFGNSEIKKRAAELRKEEAYRLGKMEGREEQRHEIVKMIRKYIKDAYWVLNEEDIEDILMRIEKL